MRNNMINTLGEDYVTFAAANGLRDRTVALLYAARNALLPNVTAFGLQLGAVVGARAEPPVTCMLGRAIGAPAGTGQRLLARLSEAGLT